MAQGKDGFRFDIVLLILAVLGIAVGGAAVYLSQRFEQGKAAPGFPSQGSRSAAAPTLSADLIEAEAALLAMHAAVAERGLVPDFAALRLQAEKLQSAVTATGRAAAEAGGKTGAAGAAIGQAWVSTKQSLDRLLAAESTATAAAQSRQELDQAADQLAQVYRDAVERMRAGVAAAGRLVLATEQIARTDRLRYLGRKAVEPGSEPAALAQQVEAEVTALLDAHAQLAGEGPVGLFLRESTPIAEGLAAAARRLLEASSGAEQLRTAAAELAAEAGKLQAAAATLPALAPATATGPLPSGAASMAAQPPLRPMILPALAMALVALLLYAGVNFVSVRNRIRKAEEKEAAQQAAILGLLDEISSLADGDLTVRASVTGEFTGAIADSINYTIETLRALVGTINETAVEISAAATATQSTAQTMRAASDNQAREVEQIARQVVRSSEALTAVAGRAEDLSREATQSVGVAHNGASTVGRTIQGMAALREQIQDTAKRIKRLGESSQEIGNIIEFINDIAEQTNTLALNASIQAAMAGESGKGFAVVADEVQRLAERAAGATRQIETLVKTIQADTNEAIVSMERSTSNVIAGARNAEEAGQSLTRIESVSTDLARLIQEISTEARSESAQATRIADEMQTVRGVAQQAAARAQSTEQAVGELEALSDKLRKSVAGFKLPPDISLETGMMRAVPKAELRT